MHDWNFLECNIDHSTFAGSTEYSPQTTSMRTVVVFVWFCTLVINAAYTANLAAFLTLQQIDDRIKTADELARQTSVKYGLLNNSDLMNFFSQSRLVIILSERISDLKNLQDNVYDVYRKYVHSAIKNI